jgi:hypothetical protein
VIIRDGTITGTPKNSMACKEQASGRADHFQIFDLVGVACAIVPSVLWTAETSRQQQISNSHPCVVQPDLKRARRDAQIVGHRCAAFELKIDAPQQIGLISFQQQAQAFAERSSSGPSSSGAVASSASKALFFRRTRCSARKWSVRVERSTANSQASRPVLLLARSPSERASTFTLKVYRISSASARLPTRRVRKFRNIWRSRTKAAISSGFCRSGISEVCSKAVIYRPPHSRLFHDALRLRSQIDKTANW